MVSLHPSVIQPHALQPISRDGLRLNVMRWEPDGSPLGSVCMAHGFGQTRLAWARSAQSLAQLGYEVLAADARGHGDSDSNPDGHEYDFTQFVADVHTVSELAGHRPLWVGASMGGLLGLVAAAESEPTPFAGLALVDITPRWSAQGVERIFRFMRAHPEGFASLDQAADAIAAYLPHRERKSVDRLRDLLRTGDDGRLRWHWDPRLLDSLTKQGDHWQPRLEAAARQLTMPLLLVSGGRSDLVGDEHVDAFLQLAPHARHHRLDDATHMVVGDRNDAFTQALIDFLPEIDFGAPLPHRPSPGHVSGVSP